VCVCGGGEGGSCVCYSPIKRQPNKIIRTVVVPSFLIQGPKEDQQSLLEEGAPDLAEISQGEKSSKDFLGIA
jgi:hypothetical protein